MVLRLTPRSSRGPLALLTPSSARRFGVLANLTPAKGRQNHTASPSASGALVSRTTRVHRIPPRERDDRVSPLCWGGTAESIILFLPCRQEKIPKFGSFIHRAFQGSDGRRLEILNGRLASPRCRDSRSIVARQRNDAMYQERPRVVPQTGDVLAKLYSARYRQLQHQELGRRPAPTCSPSKVAFFPRKKMWPVRQLNGTSHHGVMRSSLQRRGRE